ncbi:MAG: transposase [Fusobacteriaceae bacterium]
MHRKKTLKTSNGSIDVRVPRDRNSEYTPQLVKKNQNAVGQDLESKIISMYAKGMTTEDIENNITEMYGIEMSDSTISRITDINTPYSKRMAK